MIQIHILREVSNLYYSFRCINEWIVYHLDIILNKKKNHEIENEKFDLMRGISENDCTIWIWWKLAWFQDRRRVVNQSYPYTPLLLSYMLVIWISLSTIWSELKEDKHYYSSLEYEVSWLSHTFEDQLTCFWHIFYSSEINEWW